MLPFIGVSSSLKSFAAAAESFKTTELMPVLFVGHGSPMNAIEQNGFSATWRQLGDSLPKPNAILCISAHWETKGTKVTAMPQPRTIHDFGGFPQALFDVQYNTAGNPELAKEISAGVKLTEIVEDHTWGLDHGCWSILTNMYPDANIPVLQLSIDYTATPDYHYQLAKELHFLRSKGVLIMGSGNMVHNLRLVAWDKMATPNYTYDWAAEANMLMKQWISNGDHVPLIDFKKQGKAFDLAIPTPEHYIPLLYTLGLKQEKEQISFFNDETMMGSLSMTSVLIH